MERATAPRRVSRRTLHSRHRARHLRVKSAISLVALARETKRAHTIDILFLANIELTRLARATTPAVPAMPPRADAVANPELRFTRADRDDVADYFVSRYSREASREELAADMIVAVEGWEKI